MCFNFSAFTDENFREITFSDRRSFDDRSH